MQQLLPNRKHPQHPTLRYMGVCPVEAIQHCLLALSIYAPARQHGNILDPVDLICCGYACHPGIRALLSQDLAGLGIKGAEIAVVGAAHKHESSASSENGAPVVALKRRSPDFLASIQVPGLEFADVVFGIRMWQQFKIVWKANAHVELAGPIRCLSAGQRAAQILIRRNIEQPSLGIVRGWRPVFAAPRRRTVLGPFAYARNFLGIILGAASLWIDTFEDVLTNEGLGFNEINLVRTAFQGPEITVARGCTRPLMDRSPFLMSIKSGAETSSSPMNHSSDIDDAL